MTLLDTPHKKRSFTITTIILVVLLLLFFFLGLAYQIPPPESGIAINFGTTDTGSGTIQPETKTKTAPPQQQVPETPAEQDTDNRKAEDVITSTEEDAPVITPKKSQPKKEPTPSKSTQDALSNILNSPKANADSEGSQGNDNQAGDKGSEEGNPYANSYYGSPGSTGTGVTYGLKGRNLVATGKVEQECNEEGRVVVKIEVDKNGQVISAVPVVRGTTNTHPCLLEPARKTALMYRWNLDSGAPARQIGFVVINFKLGE